MQRLYDIKIEKISSEAPNYIYMLEYKIHKNDGTFRRDIDSDAARPQYLVILEKNDVFLIDEIITYIEK